MVIKRMRRKVIHFSGNEENYSNTTACTNEGLRISFGCHVVSAFEELKNTFIQYFSSLTNNDLFPNENAIVDVSKTQTRYVYIPRIYIFVPNRCTISQKIILVS